MNLVKILLCAAESSVERYVDCGDFSVLLKDNDPRLVKSLTLAEFNVAFSVYRDTVCEVYPERRVELDNYLSIISDLAYTHGGGLFYEYHKSFSSKSAMYIQRFNQRIDWGTVDLSLISRHFAGHPPLLCKLCGSYSHRTDLCPRATATGRGAPGKFNHPPSFQQPMGFGQQAPAANSQVLYDPNRKIPICMQFNENVCTFPRCKYMHICSWCGDSHSRSVCPMRGRSAPKNGKK